MLYLRQPFQDYLGSQRAFLVNQRPHGSITFTPRVPNQIFQFEIKSTQNMVKFTKQKTIQKSQHICQPRQDRQRIWNCSCQVPKDEVAGELDLLNIPEIHQVYPPCLPTAKHSEHLQSLLRFQFIKGPTRSVNLASVHKLGQARAIYL